MRILSKNGNLHSLGTFLYGSFLPISVFHTVLALCSWSLAMKILLLQTYLSFFITSNISLLFWVLLSKLLLFLRNPNYIYYQFLSKRNTPTSRRRSILKELQGTYSIFGYDFSRYSMLTRRRKDSCHFYLLWKLKCSFFSQTIFSDWSNLSVLILLFCMGFLELMFGWEREAARSLRNPNRLRKARALETL